MRNLLSSYVVVLVLLVLIVLAGFGLWGRVGNQRQAMQGIGQLEAQLADIGKKNEEMRKDIASFQETDTIEREARERLNLKKEGERVVIILPPDDADEEFNDDIILELYKRQQEGSEETPISTGRDSQIILNLKAWLALLQ